MVSDDLKTDKDEKLIRLTLQLLPEHLWPRITEVARLRIENKLITFIKAGEDNGGPQLLSGALGTWARDYLQYFTLKKLAATTLIVKLEDVDPDDRRYVARFFMSVLPTVIVDSWEIKRCTVAISSAIRNGDIFVRQQLIEAIGNYPENWVSLFQEQLKDLTDDANPAVILPDGSGFLKAPAETEIVDEDEIPF